MSKTKKEIKTILKKEDTLEFARAQKLGLNYPLSISERQKWEYEKHVDRRLAELREVSAKSTKLNAQSISYSSEPKPQKPCCVPWLHNASPEVVGQPITSDIECAVQSIQQNTMNKDCGDISFDFSGGSNKLYKIRREKCYLRYSQRVVVRIQFSPKCVKHLYISEGDLYSLIIYMGYDDNDQKRGLLFYKCKSDNVYYVEPEEICIFYIVDSSKSEGEGLLTLFRKQDELFIDKVVKVNYTSDYTLL